MGQYEGPHFLFLYFVIFKRYKIDTNFNYSFSSMDKQNICISIEKKFSIASMFVF